MISSRFQPSDCRVERSVQSGQHKAAALIAVRRRQLADGVKEVVVGLPTLPATLIGSRFAGRLKRRR